MKSIPVNIPLLKSLLSLATVIEAKDAYTGGHTWRVSRYAKMLAEQVGLSQDEAFVVYFGSLVHDIGKISVPEPVLNKPEKLTPVEYDTVKRHTEIGKTLVRDHPLGLLTLEIVASHHERYDGHGYPAGLSGNDINLMARIVSIADAFDAMTSTRPYRPGISVKQAYDILAYESGSQFDPALVSTFLEMGRNGRFDRVIGRSSDRHALHTCPVCGPIMVIPVDTRDGDHIVCPKCLGIYNVHAERDRFEIEWIGTEDLTWVPHPDMDTIVEVLRNTPHELKLSSELINTNLGILPTYVS